MALPFSTFYSKTLFFITVSFRKINNSEQTLRKINTVKSLGIFALIIGILGQLIGLFSAFRAIRFGEVVPGVCLGVFCPPECIGNAIGTYFTGSKHHRSVLDSNFRNKSEISRI